MKRNLCYLIGGFLLVIGLLGCGKSVDANNIVGDSTKISVSNFQKSEKEKGELIDLLKR